MNHKPTIEVIEVFKIGIKTGRMHGFGRRRCITVSEHDDIRSIGTKSLTFGEEQLFVLRKAHSTEMSVEDIGVCYETDRFIFCKFFFSIFLVISLGWSSFFFYPTYLYPCSTMKVSIFLYGLERLSRQAVWNPV